MSRELSARLPAAPGVYRFRDPGGRVLYVGRATNLRSRVGSYWGDLRAPETQAVREGLALLRERASAHLAFELAGRIQDEAYEGRRCFLEIRLTITCIKGCRCLRMGSRRRPPSPHSSPEVSPCVCSNAPWSRRCSRSAPSPLPHTPPLQHKPPTP
ncbi:hypothetical protein Abr02nite_28780 [Paractinoplanes brasiliensis]|nr:hypothetical protein Abr02nite_28780 [Actinoplanes brasiliensis]